MGAHVSQVRGVGGRHDARGREGLGGLGGARGLGEGAMRESVGRVVGELQLEARAAAALGAVSGWRAIGGVGGTEVVKGGVLAHGRRRRVVLLLLLLLRLLLLLLLLLLGEGALVGGGGRALLRQGRPAPLVLGRSLLDAQ